MVVPDLVRDDERGVVLDPRSRVHGAHEVVDLLAGVPRRARAEAELLVEGAHARDQLPTQEDGERDRAVPEVLARQEGALQFPGRRRGPVVCRRAPGYALEPGVLVQASRDVKALESLVAIYWKPLYFFIRQHGYDNETAKDITQEFFSMMIERSVLTKADPAAATPRLLHTVLRISGTLTA